MDVLLGLGSNIDAERNVAAALARISKHYPVLRVSRAWHTPPVGVGGAEFLNAAAVVAVLRPSGLHRLRRRLRRIERDLGRPADHDPRAARTIDLDVLAFHDATWHVVEPGLDGQVFQLLPALELAPELVLPDGRSAARVVAERPLRGAWPSEKKIFPFAAGAPQRRRPARKPRVTREAPVSRRVR